MSNLRAPKTFVWDNTAKPLIVASNKKPTDLLVGELGIFRGDTLVGAGATPAPATCPTIQFHQNVGDNSFGTVRSKVISAQKVKRWYGARQTAQAVQTTYIGYDETDSTKNIVIKKGKDVDLTVLVYDTAITRYYGGGPYQRNIPVELGLCDCDVADCTVLNAGDAAQLIADAINGVTPSGEYPEGGELKNVMTASVVTTGTGETQVWGVKIVGKAIPEQLLNSCNPKDFYEVRTRSFTVGLSKNCTNVPVTKTTTAAAGSGFAAMVANYERESQGYDRVRDQFEENMYMQNNFIIFATPGVKYDFYALEFDWTHQLPGVDQPYRTEPYVLYFWTTATTGGTFEAAMNAWLTPLGFTAVNVDSGSVTSDTTPISN